MAGLAAGRCPCSSCPTARPFYGGTYFPPAPRTGCPLPARCSRPWTKRTGRRAEVEAARQLTEPSGDGRSRTTGRRCRRRRASGRRSRRCVRQCDRRLRRVRGGAEVPARAMASSRWSGCPDRRRAALQRRGRPLDAMASGGIYDQLGGGFARYSADAQWLVPHFEKMLYDNAQLAGVYWARWRLPASDALPRSRARRSTTCSRDLRDPDGGFCSARRRQRGRGGKFYVVGRRGG